MYVPKIRRITLLREQRIDAQTLYGRFQISPFSKGQAITVANVLRRILLSELDTVSITGVAMKGVVHEFSILPGVHESVPEILHNLRNILFRAHHGNQIHFSAKIRSPEKTSQTTYPWRLQACHIDLSSPTNGSLLNINEKGKNGPEQRREKLEIVDPTQHIATLVSPLPQFEAELRLTRAKGYASCIHHSIQPTQTQYLFSQNENKSRENSFAEKFLPVDAIFMPVKRANYIIEQHDFHESIVLEIWTNGSITPVEALSQASFALRQLFQPFTQGVLD